MKNTPNYGSIAEKGELMHDAESEKQRQDDPLPNLADWMSLLPGNIPVSGLSIPGTHDSASFTSSWPYVSTQTLTITEQLEAGIRYFDLRCGLINDTLEMVHGRAVLGLKLSELLDSMYNFLTTHPGEALIVQLKQDRKDENSTLPFADQVLALMSQTPKFWRLNTTTPTLSDLRGRIQLLRRFNAKTWPQRIGIDVTRWPDNPALPFTIRTYAGVHLTIQDHYSYPACPLPTLITQKGGDISSMLTLATNDPEPWHWYINFSSAFEFNVWYQIPPGQIALGGYYVFRWVEGINLRLCNFLKGVVGEKRYRLGVVIMDFPERPDRELIACVVQANFGSEKAWRGRKKRRQWKWWCITVLLLLLLCVVFGGTVLVALRRPEEIDGHWCPRFLHSCSLRSVYEMAVA